MPFKCIDILRKTTKVLNKFYLAHIMTFQEQFHSTNNNH